MLKIGLLGKGGISTSHLKAYNQLFDVTSLLPCLITPVLRLSHCNIFVMPPKYLRAFTWAEIQHS